MPGTVARRATKCSVTWWNGDLQDLPTTPSRNLLVTPAHGTFPLSTTIHARSSIFSSSSFAFCHLRADLLHGMLHIRPVQTHVIQRHRQAPEPCPLSSLLQFFVFFLCDIFQLDRRTIDHLRSMIPSQSLQKGRAPRTILDCTTSSLPSTPDDVLIRLVFQTSVHLTFLPDISISRTFGLPLPSMLRTLT